MKSVNRKEDSLLMHTYVVTVIQTTTSLFAKRECFYAAFHLEPATNVFFKSESVKRTRNSSDKATYFALKAPQDVSLATQHCYGTADTFTATLGFNRSLNLPLSSWLLPNINSVL